MNSCIFSPDRQHRYLLIRNTGLGDRSVMFVMLNPSTADEIKNDNTITRCINFATNWGYGRLYITNLFSFRATDPKVLLRHLPEVQIIYDTNLNTIGRIAAQSDTIVFACGNHGALYDRYNAVLNYIRPINHNIFHLGLTKHKLPRHPLYVNKNQALIKLK